MSRRKPSKAKRKQRREMLDFDGALQSHLQGRLEEAEAAYRALLEHDAENPTVRHLLGRLLHQQGHLSAAIASIRKALQLEPNNPRALNDLGLVYDEAGLLDEAIDCFIRLVALEPSNAVAANNLGAVLKAGDRLPEALAAFTNAVALNPDYAEAYSNMGNTLKRLNDLVGAEAVYRKAIQLDPSMLSVYPNLAAVLRRLDRLDQAADIFSQWLEHEPNNPIALHLLSAGSGTPPPRATESYVREVFDEFAETFNEHLAKLDYQGPQLIANVLRHGFPAQRATYKVLDAGCGTGLCGPILKPIAAQLIGVDLSPKMLEAAGDLSLYDELVEADLVPYLRSQAGCFDVIASADTFGYFGELMPLLTAVGHALSDEGLLVCTFETARDSDSPSPGYQLMKTGRFLHTTGFLKSTLDSAGFVVDDWIPATLRMEANEPAPCVVVRAHIRK